MQSFPLWNIFALDKAKSNGMSKLTPFPIELKNSKLLNQMNKKQFDDVKIYTFYVASKDIGASIRNLCFPLSAFSLCAVRQFREKQFHIQILL